METKDRRSVLLDVVDGRVGVTVRGLQAESITVVERSADAAG